MVSRTDLQEVLEQILGSDEVYYQPPANVKMSYPAIRYKLDDIDNEHADNRVYLARKRYQVTFITDDPDSELIDVLNLTPGFSFDRPYVSDNLYHYVYTVFI